MLKKLLGIGILVTLMIALIGCGNSASEDLKKENKMLQGRVELLERILIEQKISLPEDEALTKPEKDKDDLIANNKNINTKKFSEVTLEVLGKKNTESNYSDFVILPFKVINRYDKEIRGIQGIMHIKDMFGEEIMSLKWNVDSDPIPVNGYIEEHNFGVDVNQFMADHMKVYNTAYENLIFEYEILKVLFSDSTVIE